MSAISLKSITGITSITTPAGVDDQLTLHTNDTTQRVKVTQSGIEVVGVSTFQDIDVDGHTNLDNVSIAGVTTTSRLDISSTTPIIDFIETDGNPDYRLYAEGGEFVIRQQNPSVSNRLVINSTGVSVPNDLDVDGHTNLDNVSVAGITTFAQAINVTGSVTGTSLVCNASAPTIFLNDTDANSDFSIQANSGLLKFMDTTNSYAVRLSINSSGNVSIAKDLDVDGHTNLDNVSIAGVSTFSGNLDANGVVYIRQNASPTIYITSNSTTGSGRLFFGDPDSDLVGRLSYVHNGDYFSFYAGYGERFRIAGNGDITATSIDNFGTGPTLKLFHNSGSPAANDVVSRISMFGDDAAGNETEYGRIETVIDSTTDSQETGHINFGTRGLGSFANVFRIKRRSTASAPSYTADDADGVILDVYNTGNPYPRYMNFIAKSAGNTDSNIGFWTEAVGGSPTEKFRITSDGIIETGTAIGDSAYDGNQRLRVGRTGDCSISIRANGSTTSATGLDFGDDDDDRAGRIQYVHSGNYMSFHINGAGTGSANEKIRITSDGYVHLGNTGHGTNSVGGQAITGQDYNPRFKIYNTTASSWLMHLRNDVSTNPNGIFMRAGNSSTNYSLYITGGDENKPHIIARGDQKVGIASATPYTTLDVGGSINAGSANQPFQRMFSAGGHQRATKHYFRCIKGTGPGTTTLYDIVTVDLNQNFHQAICKVFYGTRLQNVSDSVTQVNEIIFGINRFVGNTPTRNRTVLHQESNSANHADIDVVITSSTQYRIRLTFSSSCNGSSFAGGYVELIGVGSGGDGAFYSLAHGSGINY